MTTATPALTVRAISPSHLDAVLGRIRSIDGVYQSYRVLPGANTGD